jgi:hypothetical protein
MFGEVIILLGLLVACRPYVGSCSWLEPTGSDRIEVIAAREPIAGECECVGCSAPGLFQLRRDPYVLEFSNGNRWYPELELRAASPTGERLKIRGDRLLDIDRLLVFERDSVQFDYFLEYVLVAGRPPSGDELQPFEVKIEVLDCESNVLGTEVVIIQPRTRRDLAIEWI